MPFCWEWKTLLYRRAIRQGRALSRPLTWKGSEPDAGCGIKLISVCGAGSLCFRSRFQSLFFRYCCAVQPVIFLKDLLKNHFEISDRLLVKLKHNQKLFINDASVSVNSPLRINDVVFAFPSILLALVFVSIFGTGKYNVIGALGIAFIPSFARIVRGEFIKYREMDYVKSARLAGVPEFRIIFVHILPNAMPVLLSSIMIGFNNAVLAEAGMSYLGIGVQPPSASLGSMLSESQTYLFSAPWYALFPGLMIILMVLGLSLLADRGR